MNSLLCRWKEKFDYFIASSENANEILDNLGFGKEKCAQTYNEDQRYGYFDEHEIKYRFEKSMHGTIPFGRYVVFGCNFDEWFGGHEILREDEFNEYFEKC